jgi:hypothetical protein
VPLRPSPSACGCDAGPVSVLGTASECGPGKTLCTSARLSLKTIVCDVFAFVTRIETSEPGRSSPRSLARTSAGDTGWSSMCVTTSPGSMACPSHPCALGLPGSTDLTVTPSINSPSVARWPARSAFAALIRHCVPATAGSHQLVVCVLGGSIAPPCDQRRGLHLVAGHTRARPRPRVLRVPFESAVWLSGSESAQAPRTDTVPRTCAKSRMIAEFASVFVKGTTAWRCGGAAVRRSDSEGSEALRPSSCKSVSLSLLFIARNPVGYSSNSERLGCRGPGRQWEGRSGEAEAERL